MKNVVELPVPYLFPCLEFVFNGTHRSIPSHTYSVKDIQCGLPLILSTISNFSFVVLTSSLIYFFALQILVKFLHSPILYHAFSS